MSKLAIYMDWMNCLNTILGSVHGGVHQRHPSVLRVKEHAKRLRIVW